jgi:hypothetical protein
MRFLIYGYRIEAAFLITSGAKNGSASGTTGELLAPGRVVGVGRPGGDVKRFSAAKKYELGSTQPMSLLATALGYGDDATLKSKWRAAR